VNVTYCIGELHMQFMFSFLWCNYICHVSQIIS